MLNRPALDQQALEQEGRRAIELARQLLASLMAKNGSSLIDRTGPKVTDLGSVIVTAVPDPEID